MQQIQLGNFIFQQDDLPDEIKLGGEQMLTVIRFPGGFKEVQSFGAQDQNPAWSGVFQYQDAMQKVRKLEAMYRSGGVYPFRIGGIVSKWAVLKKFVWTYRSPFEIPYELELELAPRESLLYKEPIATKTAKPSDDALAPAPLFYTVVSGDTLWGLALRFYGDGSKYRVIADANRVADPNLILPGWKLVIPQ